MAQTFNVVRCYSCSMFQVDIDKKSTHKWTCKLCGGKQSLKQIFYQGDSKDCRDKVKELNMRRGELEQSKGVMKLEAVEKQQQSSYYDESQQYNYNTTCQSTSSQRVNKWAKYLNEEDLDKYLNKETYY